MTKDKYSALYLSHSSISDYLLCPRAYFLKNVYKDPRSNRKIQIISAPLSLGSAVHEVLEALSNLPTKQRFNEDDCRKRLIFWRSNLLFGFLIFS